MPTFKIAGKPAYIWFPIERIASMESDPGGLATRVQVVVSTEEGSAIAVATVEGRCEVLGAALDRGEPVEVGQ